MAVQTINYTNKQYLNENPSIANVNKVTDDDMNEIKEVVNNNAAITLQNQTMVNAFSDGEVYSESEVKTNSVWINNKPIYRKVVNTGALSGTTKNVAHGISNLNIVTKLYGFAITNGNDYYTIPRIVNTQINQQIGLFANATNVTIDAGSNASFANSFVVIEYTKTTD